MIVVAILGILAATAFPVYREYTQKTRDTACLSEFKGYANDLYNWAVDPNRTVASKPLISNANIPSCDSTTANVPATIIDANTLTTITIKASEGTGVTITCDLVVGSSCSK